MDNISCEGLISPNFANRPTSEISDLNSMDGLWTFVVSSGSSSSCSSETEEEITHKPRSAAKLSQVVRNALQRPADTVTDLNNDPTKPQLRSFSDNVDVKERPLMRKRAATAPPGAFSMGGYAPQLPGRAFSARLGPSTTVKRRTLQQEIVLTNPLIARMALGDTGGVVYGRHLRVPHPAKQSNSGMLVNDSPLPASFSQKARVKKTLDDINLGRLQTDIMDFESRGLLTSPTTIMKTPRESYAVPEKLSIHEEPSSPHSKDARRTIMSSLSGSSSFIKTLRYTPTNSSNAKIRPTEWQQIYLPGEICLEEHPAKLRKDSVASLDPFAKDIEPRGKRFSDLVVLDSIMVFFEDLGVVEDTTEQCLDMYWQGAEQAPRGVLSVWNSSMTSVNATPPQPPKSITMPYVEHTSPGSKFSFSSTSSTASQPRSGTPVRQRDKLKRLLSPAFPGAAFLKTTADWGHQSDTF